MCVMPFSCSAGWNIREKERYLTNLKYWLYKCVWFISEKSGKLLFCFVNNYMTIERRATNAEVGVWDGWPSIRPPIPIHLSTSHIPISPRRVVVHTENPPRLGNHLKPLVPTAIWKSMTHFVLSKVLPRGKHI